MSNRSLFEFNHDLAHRIDDDPAGFAIKMSAYIRSGGREEADALKPYGLHLFGMRHHSDDFAIMWGGHEAAQMYRAKPIHPDTESA